MTQTFAILLDAYRELNHRRLFWIALALSLLVVVSVAMVGVNERGLTILRWTIETQFINSTILPPATLYKTIFTYFGIDYWLALAATILALITTAGMIPDLVTSGSVDLAVSKPISRARLFVTKFVGGLLFSTLQVTVFTAACFLVIGLRGGEWVPGVFLAIPLVVLFYSYLYAFCVLVGVLTRSTVASLLFTLLFWFACYMLWTAFLIVNMGRIGTDLSIAAIERSLAKEVGAQNPRPDRARLEADLEKAKSWQPFWADLSRYAEWTVTPLPKTSATTDLLKRQLIAAAELPGGEEADEAAEARAAASYGRSDRRGGGNPFTSRLVSDHEFGMAIVEWQRSYSPMWIIGTSLGFVAVVLGFASWIFARRDY